MVQVTVEIAEDKLAALEALAKAKGSTVASEMSQAVDEHLAPNVSTEEWRAWWREARAEVQANRPEQLSPEELEQEITAATDEVWAERRAASRRS